MFSHNITAVISFCSNDWRFLKQCIAGVTPFCHQVIITVCDHFFDGTEENYALLEEAFRQFDTCQFLEFTFHPEKSYRLFSPFYPNHPNWRHEWHNTGRYLSYFYSSEKTDFLFFLDADEIVDDLAFIAWLKRVDLASFSALRFASFCHFREAKFEALQQEDTGLLVNKSSLQPEFLWDEDERMGLFYRLTGVKQTGVKGINGEPMIRHYTGVRTKEELLKKFSTWGHYWERKWKELIHEEFSRSFNGTDFVRKYCYREINPCFDPLEESIPTLPTVSLKEHLKRLSCFPHVTIVNPQDVLKKQLNYDLNCNSYNY